MQSFRLAIFCKKVYGKYKLKEGLFLLSVNISKSITQYCQNVVLGLLQCRVSVYTKDADFAALFQNKIAELAETELSQANKRDTIQSTRKAYKALKKDPNRYRCSAEAMCRRIAKERGLYDINNVVDITNFLSIASGYSMGTYDVAKITGDIVWKRAEEGTAYQGIGKDVLHIAFLPVLFDDLGAFGNPTSDSLRTIVTEDTKEILMVFYCFDGGEKLDMWLQQAEILLQNHAKATDFETKILLPEKRKALF